MQDMFTALISTFFIALGVILGGSVIGAMGSFIPGQHPPVYLILELAEKLKVWALVTALGGTFTAFKAIEIGFLSGQPAELFKQLALILSAFCGAQLGYMLLKGCFGGN